MSPSNPPSSIFRAQGWPPPWDGAVRMAHDRAWLLDGERRAARGDMVEPLVTFWTWTEPTISLGFLQPDQVVEARGLPVVRRPTGGGADLQRAPCARPSATGGIARGGHRGDRRRDRPGARRSLRDRGRSDGRRGCGGGADERGVLRPPARLRAGRGRAQAHGERPAPGTARAPPAGKPAGRSGP